MNCNRPVLGHKNLRKGRVSVPHCIYFITVVCKHRARRFVDFTVASQTAGVLAHSLTWSDARLHAWVLMPDHYHVLIQLGEHATLPKVMQRANSVLAIATNKVSGYSGQVWEPAYYDCAIRNAAHFSAARQYIINNPVKAGLVERSSDYPFWSAEVKP